MIDNYAKNDPRIKAIHRNTTPGFGNAVRTGLKSATGDIIIPVMADLSDDPNDIVKMVRKIDEGYDIAYGSRFCKGGSTYDYPWKKMIANRVFNNTVRFLFGIRHKDITNAFKAYRREVLETIDFEKLEANGFDLTVEIPLKAHVLGFNSVEVPVSWTERKKGEAKLKISQNGTRYGKRLLKIFIVGNLLSLRDIFKSIIHASWVHMALAILAGIVLMFGIFSLAGFNQIFTIISGISIAYVVIACIMIFMTFVVRTWRWSILLRSSGYRVHVDNAFKCIMFGWLLNYILPARIGDFARALTIKTTENAPMSVALSTIVIERAMDMLTLAFILMLAIFIMAGDSQLYIVGFLSLFAAIALVVALMVIYRFENVIVKLTENRFKTISKSVIVFKESIRKIYKNPYAIAMCLVLSMPVWLFEVASIFFAAKAINFDLSVSLSVISGIVAFIAQAIPTTPAGIGVHEGAIASVLGLWGIDLSIGTSIALVDHFSRGIIIIIFGAISAIHIGFESRQYFYQIKREETRNIVSK